MNEYTPRYKLCVSHTKYTYIICIDKNAQIPKKKYVWHIFKHEACTCIYDTEMIYHTQYSKSMYVYYSHQIF